jgi:hypothetical protein
MARSLTQHTNQEESAHKAQADLRVRRYAPTAEETL